MKYDERRVLEELVIRKARNNFLTFCLYMFPDFFKQRDFLKEVITVLNDAWLNEKKRTNVNYAMPRRSGKTFITILYCAWILGRDYKTQITIVSFNVRKSEKVITSVVEIMNSDKYKKLFDLPPLTEDMKAYKRFQGHYNASLQATSVYSGSTGDGNNVLIIDDAYKTWEEASSDVMNDKVINNYKSTLTNSLEGDKQVELVIGTRWRVGELADVLEKEEHFDYSFKIKAIDEQGNSWCESIMSIEQIEEIRKNTDPLIFNAMYLQEPMLSKNALFKRGSFRYVDDEEYESLHKYSMLAQIDPKSTGTDGYVVGIFAITDIGMILADVIRTENILDKTLIDRTINYLNYYNVDNTFIETNKEYSLSIMLKDKVTTAIHTFNTIQHKETKILTNAFKIKRDIVFRKTKDDEYNDFINEVMKYDYTKKGKRDDCVDTLVMGHMNAVLNLEMVGLNYYYQKTGVNKWE